MKFEVGEKVLWWDGEFVREVKIVSVHSITCGIVFEDCGNMTVLKRALMFDLYHETPDELLKLKERIDELRYKFENISDELRYKIEETEHDVQA